MFLIVNACLTLDYYVSLVMRKPVYAICEKQRRTSACASAVWWESSLCAQWVDKNPSFLHADSENWSDWADTQADLRLCWAQSRFVDFVMKRLIFWKQMDRFLASLDIFHMTITVPQQLTDLINKIFFIPSTNISYIRYLLLSLCLILLCTVIKQFLIHLHEQL